MFDGVSKSIRLCVYSFPIFALLIIVFSLPAVAISEFTPSADGISEASSAISPIPTAISTPFSTSATQSSIQLPASNSLAIYDIDGNSRITPQDLAKAKNNFTDSCKTPCDFDFTGDGKVTNADLLVLREHLGKVVLNTTPARNASDTFIPDELLIKFDPNISTERKAQIYKDNRIKRVAELGRPGSDNIRFASQDIDQLINNLSQNKEVVMVGKNHLMNLAFTPNDSLFPNQWNLSMIYMPQAWDQTHGSVNVKIAVVDTGVGPLQHFDLLGKIETGFNAFDESNDTTDYIGHGTQVAGIAAAATNNLEGIAGVGFNTQIIPIKVCAGVFNQCPEGTVTNGLTWLINNQIINGPRVVVNMSLGNPNGMPFVKAEIDLATRLGAIVVAAAGNDGKNKIDYPARYNNVVAVGAVLADKTHSGGSNYGPELDVVAPTGVLSTLPGNNYGTLDGTSASVPQVAGVAALYYTVGGKAPWYEFQTNTDLFLKFALQGSEDLGAPGRDDYYGYGLLNAWDVLKDKSCSRSDLNGDKEINIIDGQIISYRYGAYADNPLYAVRFDLDPYQRPDGDIDIKDLLKVFGRMGMFCF